MFHGDTVREQNLAGKKNYVVTSGLSNEIKLVPEAIFK